MLHLAEASGTDSSQLQGIIDVFLTARSEISSSLHLQEVNLNLGVKDCGWEQDQGVRGRTQTDWRSSQPHKCAFMLKHVYSGMWIKTLYAPSFVRESSRARVIRVCSPKTHQTKSESPGQDGGHPEVNVPRHSLLVLRFIFKAVEPDVPEAHSVLQTVAASRPADTKAERKEESI